MGNTKKYYALCLQEWDADDWVNFSEYGKCINPTNHSYLLFSSMKDAEEFVSKLEPDSSIHYEATIFEKAFADAEILEMTGCESMEVFNEMLATEYSDSARIKNYGEDEKSSVAERVISYGEEVCCIDCPNYEYKDIEGAIVVEWSWKRYIGYCRDLHDVRRARYGETEELLVNEDRVCARNFSMLLAKEEADSCSEDELKEKVLEELGKGCWKWNKWHKSSDDFDI